MLNPAFSAGDAIALATAGMMLAGLVIDAMRKNRANTRAEVKEGAGHAASDARHTEVLRQLSEQLKAFGETLAAQGKAYREHELECTDRWARMEAAHAASVRAQAEMARAVSALTETPARRARP